MLTQHKGCKYQPVKEKARDEREKLRLIFSRVEVHATAIKGCLAANQEVVDDINRQAAQVKSLEITQILIPATFKSFRQTKRCIPIEVYIFIVSSTLSLSLFCLHPAHTL